MRTFLQTLFFFLLVTQICFAQWYQQNSGTTKNLNAIQFLDANNGFAVGDSGIILQTSDRGTTWLQQKSGITSNLNDVKFVNATTGYAVGDSGIILNTTNRGQNWLQQPSGTSFELNAVTFIDDNSGWVVGGEYNLGYFGIILHTINGGINWSTQFEGGITLLDVCFRDANNGMVVGDWSGMGAAGDVLKTTNGGVTWTSQFNPDSGSFPLLSGISFINPNGWCAVGTTGCIKNCWMGISFTTDDGIDWNDATIPKIDGDNGINGALLGVTSIDSANGWTVGGGYVLFSDDGGINWELQLCDSARVFRDVYFLTSQYGWIVGDHGTILHTTNGGVTFVEEKQIEEMPTEFLLSQNYPNPFNPITKISWQSPAGSWQTLKIYDVLGNEVTTLVDEDKSAGTYELTWNAANLPSGVYFYQLRAGEFVQTKKMILMK